jgi:hypothetical protein
VAVDFCKSAKRLARLKMRTCRGAIDGDRNANLGIAPPTLAITAIWDGDRDANLGDHGGMRWRSRRQPWRSRRYAMATAMPTLAITVACDADRNAKPWRSRRHAMPTATPTLAITAACDADRAAIRFAPSR